MRFRQLIVAVSTTLFMVACSNDSENSALATENLASNAQQTNIDENLSPAGQTVIESQPESEAVSESSASNPTLLNSDNANAVILQALEVFSGQAYDHRLTVFPYGEITEDDNRILNNEIQQAQFVAYECNNNGEMLQTQTEQIETDGGLIRRDAAYTNCKINGDSLNGRVILSTLDFCCSWFKNEFLNDFTINFGETGILEASGTFFNEQALKNTFQVENFNYYLTYDGGSLRISNANTQRTFRIDTFTDENDQYSMMSGSFDMEAPALNGLPVSVNIEEAFSNSRRVSRTTYERGRMRISAGNNAIVIDANNDDRNTVEITVLDAVNGSSSWTQPWSTWQSALAFEPGFVTVTPLRPAPNGNGSLINSNTYQTILTEVFHILSGQRFGTEMLALPQYPYPDFPYDSFDINSFGFGDPVEQLCENEGSGTLYPYAIPAGQATYGWQSEFNNCAKQGNTYSGRFLALDYNNHFIQSNGLTISQLNSTVNFAGKIRYENQENRGGSPLLQYALKNVDFSSTHPDRFYEINGANIEYLYSSPFSVFLSGEFSLNSAVTQQNTVHVVVADPLYEIQNQPFDQSGSLNHFTAGLLVIDAGNGNELHLNADTDDDETFQIILFQQGNESQIFVENWADWQTDIDFQNDLDSLAPVF